MLNKRSPWILCASLALAGVAGAQDQGQSGAEAKTSIGANAAVTADEQGVNARNRNTASSELKTDQASAQLAGGTEINATLTQPVDARKSKPGDEVTATAAEDIKSGGQVIVPRGSKLIGRVTEAKPKGSKRSESKETDGEGSSTGEAAGAASAAGSLAGSAAGSAGGSATKSGARAAGSAAGEADSRLGLVFDRAVLKDGREVPLQAGVQALATANAAADAASHRTQRSAAGSARGATSAAGSAQGSGGGLVGGVTGTVGGAAQGATSIAGNAGGTLGATGNLAGQVSQSAGAAGGLNAAGHLTSGSKGVFGTKHLDIVPAAGSAQGSVITSATQNVRLDKGTQLLLITRGSASGSASQSVEGGNTTPRKDTR